MNFLAHYFFDRSDDVYQNVGLILPDLSRNFCKGHLNLKQDFEGNEFNALKTGSLKHLSKDKLFHQSEFFKNAQKSVSDLLDKEALWPRKWFLNHVLTEIMLDRVLMDAHPQLCTDFYKDLGHADPAIIADFLKQGGVLNYHLFKEHYLKFNEHRFIFNYLHNEKLIIALSRLYLKVGIQYAWQKADEDLLNRHFVAILDIIAPQVDYLTKELKLNIDEHNKQM